jgi:hypothetical protein
MTTLDDLAARLERVETQLALHRLAADYCIGADQQDLARFTAVWTEDGLWDATGDEPDDAEHLFRGVQAICTAVQEQWATFPRMQHATANHVVELDPNDSERAKGRCDVVVTVQLPDGRWVVGGGVYEDLYKRQDGVWRIASRSVRRPFDLQPLPARGDLTRTPPPDTVRD